MVVCKCRKATKLYCFVHNVPVCGECICFPEHQICVVKMYSEWVIDAEYDWPPKCPSCHKILQEGGDSVARLGCLHVLHNSCLVSHLQNFPPQTIPAGYTCPSCSIQVWPPKSIRDLNSTFSSRLKDIISQSGLSETLLGRDATSFQHSARLVPSSLSASSGMNNSDFASIAPRIETSISSALNLGDSSSNRVNGSSSASSLQTAIDIDGYTANSNGAASRSPYSKMANPPLTPGATTRIKSSRGGKLGNNEDDYDDNADVNDDDDGARRKYNRRGPFYRHFLRFLLPFWRTSLPTLPVTAPPVRKDDRESLGAEDIIEGRSRRRKRSSSVDPMKVILFFAIMSCMATILMLYYRLAQGGTKEEHSLVEGQ